MSNIINIYYALSGNYIGTLDITDFTRIWTIKNYIKTKIKNYDLYSVQIILLHNDNIITEDDIILMNINVIYIIINQYLSQTITYYENKIKYNTIVWFQKHDTIKDISQTISQLVNISQEKLKLTFLDYGFLDGHQICTITNMNNNSSIIEYFYNCASVIAHI